MIETFARLVTGLNTLIGKVAAWAVIPLFLLLFSAVVMRYFVGQPLIWVSEVAQLIFGVYAVIGGGYLLSQRGHVNVDIFYGTLSQKQKAALDIATSILFFLFIYVLLMEAISLAEESLSKWERSNSAWRAPVWPVKLALPIAAALLLLQGIVKFIADVRILLGLPVDEAAFGIQAEDGTAE